MSSGVPRYHQVYTVLRQRIADGDYAPGEQLPPEDVLAREWEVSRATLRQAVGLLVAAGSVRREQGRGTFVIGSQPEPLSLTFHSSLEDLIASSRVTKLSSVRVDRRQTVPAQVANRLELPTGIGTIVRRVRVGADGRPFGTLINYLADDLGKNVTVSGLRRATLLELLEAQGVDLGGAEQRIRAEAADIDVAADLDITVSQAVLAVERLVHDTEGRPVELLRSWYRSDMYHYRMIFGRDDVAKRG